MNVKMKMLLDTIYVSTLIEWKLKLKFSALFMFAFMLSAKVMRTLSLGTFTKLQKATISFVMVVCPSTHLHGTQTPTE